ncbi:2-phospho-L-lactate transferase [Actinomyces israelii]|uniref:2-phospho-L-lactate transferase n=1 Tax=Actinomyces israelii TaxID=1659 RepID=UPI00235660DC|nr:2-phospho-L-lactate transferase [Actinomyces israelii]
MRIAVVAGGVGGARFTRGLRDLGENDLSIIVNVGDDAWVDGLRVCPDLDSQMYALAGIHDSDRGWGRRGDSMRIDAELRAWDFGARWFTLGDLDIAAHIMRTAMLHEGSSLTEATDRLCSRWNLGARLLPASDDRAETWVDCPSLGGPVHFQEWWVRHRAIPRPTRFLSRPGGAELSDAAQRALALAELVIVAPSNPVVSIDPVLNLKGARAAFAACPAPVVGISPVVGGRVLRGMGDVCLSTIGVSVSAAGVAEHYGARGDGLLDAWVVDEVDAGDVPRIEALGIRSIPVMTVMKTPERARRLAATVVSLGRELSVLRH